MTEIQLEERCNVRSRFEKNSCPIDITRKPGKFCNVSFNPTFWPWWRHPIGKWLLHLRKRIVSAITYWNLGENRPRMSEICTTEYKIYDVTHVNSNFWFWTPISWRHNDLVATLTHQIISTTHMLSDHVIKNGGFHASNGGITVLK